MIFTSASSEVFLSFLLNKVEAIVCSFLTQVKTESHNTKKQRCNPPHPKPSKSSSQALVKYLKRKGRAAPVPCRRAAPPLADVLRPTCADASHPLLPDAERPSEHAPPSKKTHSVRPFPGFLKKRKKKGAQPVPFRVFLEKMKINPRTPNPVHAQYACGIWLRSPA